MLRIPYDLMRPSCMIKVLTYLCMYIILRNENLSHAKTLNVKIFSGRDNGERERESSRET